MPVQSAEIIGFEKETTFGTFANPTQFIPGLCTINTTTKVARPEQSRGAKRDYVVDALVGIEAGATVSAELIPEVLGRLTSYWMGEGADTKTGANPYTHTLKPQILVPSMSLEVANDSIAQVLARKLTGGNVDQIVLRGVQQALATMEFTMLFQKEATAASPNEGKPFNPTPTINSQIPIDHSRLTAKYKGTELGEAPPFGYKPGELQANGLQDYTLTMMNHVQRVYASNKQIYAVRLVPTRREIQLQTTHDFMSPDLYNDWITGAYVGSAGTPAFEFIYTTPYEEETKKYKYEITFKVARLRPMGPFNLQSASDVLNQQLTWSTTLGEEAAIVESIWKNADSVTWS